MTYITLLIAHIISNFMLFGHKIMQCILGHLLVDVFLSLLETKLLFLALNNREKINR